MLDTLLSNIVFIQFIGFIAFGLGVTALLNHDDKKLKILMTAQCLTLSIHFLLLGAEAAAAATLIAGIRNIVSIYTRIKSLAILFITTYIVMGYLRYEEWVDLLPTIGCILSTIGFFYLKDIPMRLFMLATTTLWIIHNAVSVSIGPFLMEVGMFIANLQTIYAIYQKQKNHPIPIKKPVNCNN